MNNNYNAFSFDEQLVMSKPKEKLEKNKIWIKNKLDNNLKELSDNLFKELNFTGYKLQNKQKMLHIILTNLKRLYHCDNNTILCYYKRKCHYSNFNVKKYNMEYYTYTNIIDVTKKLEEYGYISTITYNYNSNREYNLVSELKITEKLMDQFKKTKEKQVLVDNNDEVIRLQKINDNNWKYLADYSETKQTRKWRKELEKINKYLSKYFNREVFLYRKFNDNFDSGGRLYQRYDTDFWMYDKNKRKKLGQLYNDNVIELDYSAMYVRMMYAILGMQFDGECYVYAKNDERNKQKRKDIKQVVLAAVNTDNKQAAINAVLSKKYKFLTKYWQHGKRSLTWAECDQLVFVEQDKLRLDDAYDTFFLAHPSLKQFIGTNMSLQFQKIDSGIMLNILKTLVDLKIPALPIHDAVLIAEKNKDIVLKVMKEKYKEVMRGFDIPISVTHISDAPSSYACKYCQNGTDYVCADCANMMTSQVDEFNENDEICISAADDIYISRQEYMMMDKQPSQKNLNMLNNIISNLPQKKQANSCYT